MPLIEQTFPAISCYSLTSILYFNQTKLLLNTCQAFFCLLMLNLRLPRLLSVHLVSTNGVYLNFTLINVPFKCYCFHTFPDSPSYM